MNELSLPEGYSLETGKVVEIDYTFLRKNGILILALPSEHCPPEKIAEVVHQTKG